MSPAKIVLVVMGAVAALIGFGLTLGGGALVWAHATQRDDGGYYSTGTHRFETPTAAIISDRIDLRTDVRDGTWFGFGSFGSIRIVAEAADEGGAVFVGIASSDEVERFLSGAAHDELTDVSFRPFRADYRRHGGDLEPSSPADEAIWVASGAGEGRQTLTWDVGSGDWTVVVMNADASPGVATEMSVGFRTGLVLPIGLGVGATGLFLLAGAAILLVVGLRRDTAVARGAAVPVTPFGVDPDPLVDTGPVPTYPTRLDGRLESGTGRWLWLVKWVLVLPHVVVLTLFWVAAVVLTVVAGLAILLTGRYPRSIFDFNVGVLRWTWRVSFYSFGAFATDRYPPFTLAPDPDYPASFDVPHPEQLSRGLVLVKWWLLALPHLIIVAILTGGWGLGGDDGWRLFGSGGLIAVVALIAAVVLAVTSRYPRELFDFVMGLNRWVFRVLAYVMLMRDEYPPFRFDDGGPDPAGAPTEAVPPPDPSPLVAGRR